MNNKNNIYNLSLKTGKENISYSEIKTWAGCSLQHKLIYIDKLSKDEDTVYTCFGTSFHKTCEAYVLTKILKYELAIAELSRLWDKNNFPNKFLWIKRLIGVLEKFPNWLNSTFPGWEAVSAEELIFENIPGSNHKNVKFKGYIDAIIKYKDKYIILDWKQCGLNGWPKYKKEDFITQMQLIYYDIFFSLKHNIPKDKINCFFVLFNREALEGADFIIDLLPLNITDDKRKKSLNILNNMISSTKRGVSFKAWKSVNAFGSPCKFCEFNGTQYCP